MSVSPPRVHAAWQAARVTCRPTRTCCRPRRRPLDAGLHGSGFPEPLLACCYAGARSAAALCRERCVPPVCHPGCWFHAQRYLCHSLCDLLGSDVARTRPICGDESPPPPRGSGASRRACDGAGLRPAPSITTTPPLGRYPGTLPHLAAALLEHSAHPCAPMAVRHGCSHTAPPFAHTLTHTGAVPLRGCCPNAAYNGPPQARAGLAKHSRRLRSRGAGAPLRCSARAKLGFERYRPMGGPGVTWLFSTAGSAAAGD